jgi:hypothetical protein
MSQPDDSYLSSIQSSLDSLRTIAVNSPDKASDISRELQLLYDRYNSYVEGKTPLSAPPPSFEPDRRESVKYKNTRGWRELSALLGPTMKITEARKAADALSRARMVHLSPEVRNHADKLMGWFEANWEALAPAMSPGSNLAIPLH